MSLTKQTTNALIQLVDREIRSLNDVLVQKTVDDPDIVDTDWYADKARYREKLKTAQRELNDARKAS